MPLSQITIHTASAVSPGASITVDKDGDPFVFGDMYFDVDTANPTGNWRVVLFCDFNGGTELEIAEVTFDATPIKVHRFVRSSTFVPICTHIQFIRNSGAGTLSGTVYQVRKT